jgi:dTDP-4-amino-4,6-dideoxygalactose transaminase
MPVSLFGLSADMAPILALARQHELYVIEDAACAVGAWYNGHHAGALADLGAVSFHPRKAITTGEGGMLLTQDEGLAAKVRALRDHGATVSDLQRHQGKRSFLMPEYDMVGYNYRMTDLQGALGVAQMGKLEEIMARRKRLAQRYDQAFAGLDWLKTPATPEGYLHGYQAYVCMFQPEAPSLDSVEALYQQRNELMGRLEDAGVATRQGTQAVHTLGYYRQRYDLVPEDYPNSFLAERCSLALPLYPQMSAEEQNYVIEQIKRLGMG